MRHLLSTAGALCMAASLLMCDAGAQRSKKVRDPATPAEKFSYAVGLDIGSTLKEMPTDFDIDQVISGMHDTLQGKSPRLSMEEILAVKRETYGRMQEEQTQKQQMQGEKNKRDGEEFLAANKEKEGVITTASGLQYQVIKQGEGARPKASDTVSVHYIGTLLDGMEFDNSHKRGEPAKFAVNRIIPGWSEALQLMNEGSTWKLFIPPDLGYGARGAGQKIGPNAVLIFEVSLLKIET